MVKAAIEKKKEEYAKFETAKTAYNALKTTYEKNMKNQAIADVAFKN